MFTITAGQGKVGNNIIQLDKKTETLLEALAYVEEHKGEANFIIQYPNGTYHKWKESVNFRKILKEYMKGVGMSEGVDFIDMIPADTLSLSEMSELYRISEEICEDYEKEKALKLAETEKKIAETDNSDIYVVSINGRAAVTVFSEGDAWDVIGKAQFGSVHIVRDGDGNTREEFVPF